MKLKYLPLVTLIITTLLCGCQSTPKQVAYQSLASIGAAANTAADALAQARFQGKVSDVNWAKAVEVQKRFLLAYGAACQTAAYDFSSFAPADLIALETELLNTVNAILK